MSFFVDINKPQAPIELTSSIGVSRSPDSGISVLIVGAGPAGLVAALECWRKGHDVHIIERTPAMSTAGDFFSLTPSITRHFQKTWPNIANEDEKITYRPWVSYHKITGERITDPAPVDWGNAGGLTDDGDPPPTEVHRHSRPKFVRMLISQLLRLGIQLDYGKRAMSYFEDEHKAGVVLENGVKYEADIVVAADGIGTKSHALVNGHDIRAFNSGYSIFRTAYPVELALADPVVADRFPLLPNGHPHFEMWAGPDMHASIFRTHDLITWLITHKDIDDSAKESWHQTVSVDKVLAYTATLPEWPEYMNRLIKTVPENGIVDWKLAWRDPQPNWTSPSGRVVQIGDSAHSFLPTSGNGANQAMEDGISLASCLQLAGKDNVSWATRVHNKLRFERVACCQLLGLINFRHLHYTDWSEAKKSSKDVKSEIGRWVWAHNPEKYVYDKYNEAFEHVRDGKPFQNTNIPPGYTYQPWTIEGVFTMMREGKELKFDGDWS